MSTIDKVSTLLDVITNDEYTKAGWFTTLSIVTPDSEKYFSTLAMLGFEGEINMTPDKTGIVATMFTTSDSLMGVVVGFQGERPAKVKSDESDDDEEESDIEDDE